MSWSWFHGLAPFLAAYFVFFLGAIAAAVVVVALAGRPVVAAVRWFILAAFVAGSSAVLGFILSLLHYENPVRTIQPPPWPNSFPSHHALLAAALVAFVFLLRPSWSLLLVPLALVVDIALIVDRDHRIQDVIASDLVVIAMTVVAIRFGIPLLLRAQPLLDRFAHRWESFDRRTRSWVLWDERGPADENRAHPLAGERGRNRVGLDTGGNLDSTGFEHQPQRVERHG